MRHAAYVYNGTRRWARKDGAHESASLVVFTFNMTLLSGPAFLEEFCFSFPDLARFPLPVSLDQALVVLGDCSLLIDWQGRHLDSKVSSMNLYILAIPFKGFLPRSTFHYLLYGSLRGYLDLVFISDTDDAVLLFTARCAITSLDFFQCQWPTTDLKFLFLRPGQSALEDQDP